MNTAEVLKWLLGVVTVAALSLAGWALQRQAAADTRLALLEQRLAAANTKRDDDQDKTLSRFWKLHSWERKQINELRVKSGLPIADEPDLGN